jgi:putative membrane protein insertion efficiency factor
LKECGLEIFRASVARAPRNLARSLVQIYRISLSALIGRNCRYLPTCSAYMDESLALYGLWAGGWLGLSRLCRCHPWGGDGFDPVPRDLPSGADALHPWRYGKWRQTPRCEPVEPEKKV